MKLSKYFDTNIDTKILNGNTPTNEQIENLKVVCEFLDSIREKFGTVIITSGLRSNSKQQELIKQGVGASNSKHLTAQALDFVTTKAPIDDVFNFIKEKLLDKVDKVLLEKNSQGARWIHVSVMKEGNRHEAYIANQVNGSMQYKLLKKI